MGPPLSRPRTNCRLRTNVAGTSCALWYAHRKDRDRFKPLSLAPGGLHEPADADDPAGDRGARVGDDGPRERPLPDRAQPDRAQARGVVRGRPPARDTALRERPG